MVLLLLVFLFSTINAQDLNNDGIRRSVSSSTRRVNLWDEEADEKSAKRQKKFGSRVSASKSKSSSPKRAFTSYSDPSKLGHEPSRYSDEKKRNALKLKRNFSDYKIRYMGLAK